MNGPLTAILAPLVGLEIAGGCVDCDDPYQTVEERHGTWLVTVHHGDCCPVLARYRRGGGI